MEKLIKFWGLNVIQSFAAERISTDCKVYWDGMIIQLSLAEKVCWEFETEFVLDLDSI